MKRFLKFGLILVLLLVCALGGLLADAGGVPIGELRRGPRRAAVRDLRNHPVRALGHTPALVWVHSRLVSTRLFVGRTAFVARRHVKYDLIEGSAALLAVYCWATRQEGFEGLRMSYWRWNATIHLALKERAQRSWAVACGDSEYWTSGGPVTLRPNGNWQPVPAGAAGITRVGQVSPLYYKKVAGGLPILQDLTFFPGNIFFVDSGTTVQGGATSGFGTHPDSPVLLIDTAINLCTASQADAIFALPGHAEDLDDTLLIDADEQGISIIGVGRGPDRPTLTYDHIDALVSVGAHGVLIKNIVLLPSLPDVVAAIDVETTFTDVVLEDLECIPGEDGAGADEFVDAIQNQVTCTRLQILGLLYAHHASAASPQSAIHIIDLSDRVHIANFWIEISGAGAVAGIENITNDVTRILIEHGTITTDAEPGIELVTGATGSIEFVHIFADLGTIDAATVADACAHHEVYYTEVGNEASTRVKTESVDD